MNERETLGPAPCKDCGYNGPGYYQPETHPCAVPVPRPLSKAVLRAAELEAAWDSAVHNQQRAEAAEVEVARLLEIKVYAEKAYEELRADLTAKVERLEHELDDAKRSRDDAIGRYVEAQAEPALSEKP